MQEPKLLSSLSRALSFSRRAPSTAAGSASASRVTSQRGSPQSQVSLASADHVADNIGAYAHVLYKLKSAMLSGSCLSCELQDSRCKNAAHAAVRAQAATETMEGTQPLAALSSGQGDKAGTSDTQGTVAGASQSPPSKAAKALAAMDELWGA